MKVGFDISQLAHFGGVATYTDNLTRELSKIKDLEMVYFYSSLRKPYKGKLKNVKSFKLPPTLFEVLFNRYRNVAIEKFIGEVEVFHSSDWVQPPTKAKKVTTYHDVIPLKFPQWSTPKIVEVHKRRLKIVEREIDMVIADSLATKKDLLEISKIPEEKIVVIYGAASDVFRRASESEIEKFKKEKGLPDKFVLAIGGVGTRRNLEKVREIGKDFSVVITGENIGMLSNDEMPLLYSSAQVLLYPSFYEGFGLPILEAQKCGLVVITSNVSSMSEVGGDSVLYVDPNSLEDIKSKVTKVLEDKDLREDLIKKGFENSNKFSWEKTAEKTCQIYKNLIRG